MRLLIFASLLFLSSCTSVGHVPPYILTDVVETTPQTAPLDTEF